MSLLPEKDGADIHTNSYRNAFALSVDILKEDLEFLKLTETMRVAQAEMEKVVETLTDAGYRVTYTELNPYSQFPKDGYTIYFRV